MAIGGGAPDCHCSLKISDRHPREFGFRNRTTSTFSLGFLPSSSNHDAVDFPQRNPPNRSNGSLSWTVAKSRPRIINLFSIPHQDESGRHLRHVRIIDCFPTSHQHEPGLHFKHVFERDVLPSGLRPSNATAIQTRASDPTALLRHLSFPRAEDARFPVSRYTFLSFSRSQSLDPRPTSLHSQPLGIESGLHPSSRTFTQHRMYVLENELYCASAQRS
ncbi:hypothetical protein BU26DRAFT_504143 [Trematosphaeria pertusa]|uniref:Uncharacterized protein n=1 Tax=Trematosphaeria pertusa TaxID=390896 RepID=A0A6A6IHK1_9PLEO|nr:uncharacterized protein BU26DRAFT_504143 [Trematosphaeria pertusa]KAF2249689.1 hypothetical protein BU26DRAFT_504143 [Trematosphaeria pertusa]